MNILLAYATYSSGTDLASSLVEELFREKQMDIARKDIREVSPASLSDYDVIVFASPSWRTRLGDGHPHEFFLAFMDEMKDRKLPPAKYAVMGLGDKAYTHFCGAVDHLETFIKERGGTLLIPSLKIDGFYFDQKNNENRIRDWTEKLVTALQA